MDHSYEEIRSAALDLLAGREKASHELSQYQHLLIGIGEVFLRREGAQARRQSVFGDQGVLPSQADQELFMEVFWDLFRQGIITLGYNASNREFPFFRVCAAGKRLLDGGNPYFFHDVSSFTKIVRTEVPDIDEVTLLYLQEAMQAFRSGCLLSATVMLGVATEHTFLRLVEAVESNPTHSTVYASVGKERTILQKVNKFKNLLDQQIKSLPSEVKEDLDTNFVGILAVIRNFRNQAGHPTGKLVDREQVFVLLQLFVTYCRKMYQLLAFFSK